MFNKHSLENIQKVSLIFFLIIGFTHIISSLMISNAYLLNMAKIANRTLDIPFIATGLLYGLSSLRLNLARDEKNHTMLDAVLVFLAVIIFVGVIAINVFIHDI